MFGFLKLVKKPTATEVAESFSMNVAEAKAKALAELERIEQQQNAHANRLDTVIFTIAEQKAQAISEARTARLNRAAVEAVVA
jgi:anion-transporting  ArsA/GET3 family ATPase